MNQTSVRPPLSPLERDWSSKPIIYIINNSLAFRYVKSQIWKYYGILGFVPNEREVRYTSTKPHFANSKVCKPFKYTALSVYVRDVFRIRTWSLSSGLCFQVHTSWLLLPVIKQRCITPFWIEGELPAFVVRLHAPNWDGTNTCTVPPLIYI